MGYSLEMEVKGHCLFAAACGVRTSENVSAIAKAVFDECIKKDIVDVFVDLRRLTGRLNISESLAVITVKFPEIGLFQKLQRVAVLESSERYERSRFFERAASAKGFNIRMFDDQEEAVDWLSGSRQPR